MPKLSTNTAPRKTELARSLDPDVILGVDPGYAALGLALVWRRGPGRYTLLRGRTLRPDGSWGERAAEIVREINGAVLLTPPGAMVLENITQAQVAQSKRGHFRVSNLRVNEVVGLLRGWAACRVEPLPLIELQATQWKKRLGVGARADKAAVRAMVERRVEGLPARMSEHLADAVGIAVAGFGGGR